ncbi:hypothetical protein CRYUN_Cryun32bG0040200 [Craigia yunnanensis]
MEVENTRDIRHQYEGKKPQPQAVVFPEEVEQEWERQQVNLESLVEEATRYEDSLFNTTNFSENPELQPENNIPR